MEHEMYNDGLYFTEQAAKEKFYGDIQRSYRFAVVSFASSFESFINRRLKSELEKDINKVPNGQELLDFLNEGFRHTSVIPSELRNISKKMRILEVVLGLKVDTFKTADFIIFNEEIIKLRNTIVHYSHSGFTTVYENDLKKAALNGTEFLVNTIQSMCDVSSLEFPAFYSNMNYQPIE